MANFQVSQIQKVLEKDFIPHIFLDDVGEEPEEKRETTARSRALAAFYLAKQHGLPVKEACRCVTDGRDDKGIDALAVTNSGQRTLIIVQSKWSQNGKASGLDKSTLLRLQEGIDLLVQNNWESFNSKISSRRIELEDALLDTDLKIEIALLSLTTNTLDQNLASGFEHFLSRVFNDEVPPTHPEAVASFEVCGQSKLHGLLGADFTHSPVNLTVQLQDFGRMASPYKAFYGHVSGSDVATWLQENKNSLMRQNVRFDLGTTEANKGIRSTIEEKPEDFWYLNNGITVLCDAITKAPQGGASTASGMFDVKNARIVNGAQTSSTLSRIFANSDTGAKHCEQVRVMVKFISLEDAPEDFAERVTRATNTQNAINTQDFASLDSRQRQLKSSLAIESFQYLLRSGEELSEGETGCTFAEAAVSLATVHSVELATQAKREISKLWENVHRTPYLEIFPSNLSALRLRRAYDYVDSIESQLATLRPSFDGRTLAYSQHGNRFVEFTLSKINDFATHAENDNDKAWGAWLDTVKTQVEEMVKTVQKVGDEEYSGYTAALFKNKQKTQRLAELILDESKHQPSPDISRSN